MQKFNIIVIVLLFFFPGYIHGTTTIMDEFEENCIGNEYGITYKDALYGKGAEFLQSNESRVQYPFSLGIPKQGSLEFIINIKRGYWYRDYELRFETYRALIFTTDIQCGDVTWPGSMWLYVYANGDIQFHIAGEKYDPGWEEQYILWARGTSFRFNEWHHVGVSFGDQGQWIMVDGEVVASKASNTQELGCGGNHSQPVDIPTLGESVPGFWKNNQWEGSFEGLVECFRVSDEQRDWVLQNKLAGSSDIPLVISVDSLQTAGTEFWVDVNIGTLLQQVNNLFGCSFTLHFDSRYVEIAEPDSLSILPGDFLGTGTDIIFFSMVSDDSINIAITRRRGDTNVNGYGNLARIKFHSFEDTPSNTHTCFGLSSITANDSAWNPITLTPKDSCIIINGHNLIVWPGDTNNDGKVNQADVLPIGLCWNLNGSARPDASLEWKGQSCQEWYFQKATYADADGNGLVDEADVRPIGLNWDSTHVVFDRTEKNAALSSSGRLVPVLFKHNDEIYIALRIENIHDLYGIAFDLTYPLDQVELISIRPSSCWSSNRLFYSDNNESTGKCAVAICKCDRNNPLDGTHDLMKLVMKPKNDNNNELSIQINELSSINSRGDALSIFVGSLKAANQEAENPGSFYLSQNYPNPFNSSTKIKYTLPREVPVNITVYNLLGVEIASLVNEKQPANNYEVIWNGLNAEGSAVSSGIYYYKITAGDFTFIRKCLFLK